MTRQGKKGQCADQSNSLVARQHEKVVARSLSALKQTVDYDPFNKISTGGIHEARGEVITLM